MYSTLLNVTVVNDFGFFNGIAHATLKNVEIVNVYGKYSLEYSEINNNDIDNMTINLYGDYSGSNATINCIQDTYDDLCTINCLSNTACIGLIIHCYATCIVNCDESQGITCPDGYYGPSSPPTQIPSFNPSQFPSLMPTILPSKLPSKLPSIHPTVIPSAEPTSTPTSIPSGVPSGMPSGVPSSLPSKMPTNIPTARTAELQTTAALATTKTATTTTTTHDVDTGSQSIISERTDLLDCVNDHTALFWVCLFIFIFLIISIVCNAVLLTKNKYLRKSRAELRNRLSDANDANKKMNDKNGSNISNMTTMAPMSMMYPMRMSSVHGMYHSNNTNINTNNINGNHGHDVQMNDMMRLRSISNSGLQQGAVVLGLNQEQINTLFVEDNHNINGKIRAANGVTNGDIDGTDLNEGRNDVTRIDMMNGIDIGSSQDENENENENENDDEVLYIDNNIDKSTQCSSRGDNNNNNDKTKDVAKPVSQQQ